MFRCSQARRSLSHKRQMVVWIVPSFKRRHLMALYADMGTSADILVIGSFVPP